MMKISYKRLWMKLVEHDLTHCDFRKTLGIATGTMTKLRKGELVSLDVLLRVCEFFNCNIGDICDAVPENTKDTTDNANDYQI